MKTIKSTCSYSIEPKCIHYSNIFCILIYKVGAIWKTEVKKRYITFTVIMQPFPVMFNETKCIISHIFMCLWLKKTNDFQNTKAFIGWYWQARNKCRDMIYSKYDIFMKRGPLDRGICTFHFYIRFLEILMINSLCCLH